MTAVRVIIIGVCCTGNWKVLRMESILGVMVLAIRDDGRETPLGKGGIYAGMFQEKQW